MLARLPSVPVDADSLEADMLKDGFLEGWTREGLEQRQGRFR
jgi:hypothetical protein